jgi:hypothetical protein
MTAERVMQWFIGIVMVTAWMVTEATNCHVDKLPETAIGVLGTLIAWNAGAAAYKKAKTYKIGKK